MNPLNEKQKQGLKTKNLSVRLSPESVCALQDAQDILSNPLWDEKPSYNKVINYALTVYAELLNYDKYGIESPLVNCIIEKRSLT